MEPSKLSLTGFLDAACHARQLRTAEEKRHFSYLPTEPWFRMAGYTDLDAGSYRYGWLESKAYEVRLLSQTGMTLLFLNERFIAGQVITSDTELQYFLTKNNFPDPQSPF